MRVQGLGSISNISVSLGLQGLTADLKFAAGRADSLELDIDLEEMIEVVSISMRKARAGLERLGAVLKGEPLQTMLAAASGYAYFLQAYGRTLWEAASQKEITLGDAKLAVELGTADLDHGFFVARWQRATPAERRYLRAMSQDGEGPTATADLSGRLGKDHSSLTSQRSRLIEKGIIFAPEHGLVQFTVPGMGAFITRQQD